MEQRYTSDMDILYDRETLQAYVLGTLSKERMEEITQAAAGSEALATRIEGMRFLLEQEGEAGIPPFLAEVWGQHEQMIEDFCRTKRESKKVSSRPPFFTYAIAAAFALLIGIGAFLINQRTTVNPLDQALAESFPLIHTQIIRSQTTEQELWEEAYEKENFPSVINELSPKLEKNESEQFYLGMAYLKEAQYPEAISSFQEVISRANRNGFLEQARWFCALAYMKAEQPAQARALLDEIITIEGHYKQVEARELLSDYPSI